MASMFFVSVCVLLFCLVYVAVCSTSLVCAVRSVSQTLAREQIKDPHRWLYLDVEVLVLPPVLSSELCLCWLPIFVDNQLPPTRIPTQFLLLCWCACPAWRLCHSPRCFFVVFL